MIWKMSEVRRRKVFWKRWFLVVEYYIRRVAWGLEVRLGRGLLGWELIS